eukprot:1183264-Prorocentrum_minimum.AAC.1
MVCACEAERRSSGGGDNPPAPPPPPADLVPREGGFEGAKEGYNLDRGGLGPPDRSAGIDPTAAEGRSAEGGANCPANPADRSDEGDPTAEDELQRQHRERLLVLEKAVAKLDQQVRRTNSPLVIGGGSSELLSPVVRARHGHCRIGR